MLTVYDAYYIDNMTTISIGLDSVQLYTIIKGSLDEKLPSYELLKMLKETDQ